MSFNPFWRNTKTEKHRGDQQKQWNQSQVAKSNAGLAAAGGYGSQAGSTGSYLTGQLEGIAANPMSAEEKAGRLSSVGSAYDAMGAKAGERVAKTRNSAGYGALLDSLAQQKGKAMGETSADIGNTEYQRKMAALSGIGGMYGTQVGAQTNLLRPGQPVQQPGFWDNFLNTVVQGGAQVGSAYLANS